MLSEVGEYCYCLSRNDAVSLTLQLDRVECRLLAGGSSLRAFLRGHASTPAFRRDRILAISLPIEKEFATSMTWSSARRNSCNRFFNKCLTQSRSVNRFLDNYVRYQINGYFRIQQFSSRKMFLIDGNETVDLLFSTLNLVAWNSSFYPAVRTERRCSRNTMYRELI